jgi:hypothetical protein
MNPLQKLINSEMKEQGIKRSVLATRIGYSNTTKGLRRLDAMLDTLEGREHLLHQLQDALKIPDEKFQTAVSALEEEIHAKYRAEFIPYIHIVPNGQPRRYSFFSRKPWWMAEINIPKYLSSLPIDQELSVVCGLCRTHRLRYEVELEGISTTNKDGDKKFERASKNLLLPTDQETPSTCKMCGMRRKSFKETIKGFIYHRNYDQHFELDHDCFLRKYSEYHAWRIK